MSPRTKAEIASRDRLPSLTGLRFLAALLVVLYHFSSQVGPVRGVTSLVQYGRTGVTFFFVLSGFVLAWTYFGKPVAFRVFLWRRFARLWPLVLATGVLSLIAYRYIATSVDGPRALSTFVFLQAWRSDWAAGANPAAWSLSDEAFFYLLFPILLVIAASVLGRRLMLFAVVIAVPLGWWLFAQSGLAAFWFDYFPPARMVQFAVGVLAGVAMRRGLSAPLRYWPAVALVFVFHALLAVWGDIDGLSPNAGPYSGSQWWSILPFTLLIMAAAQADLDGKPTGVRSSVAIRLGHWSYALYLVHEIIVRVWVDHFGRPTGAAIAAEWAILIVLATAASGILYSLIEHPAEKWLRAKGPQPRTFVRARG